jgi:hypothetical protein
MDRDADHRRQADFTNIDEAKKVSRRIVVAAWGALLQPVPLSHECPFPHETKADMPKRLWPMASTLQMAWQDPLTPWVVG